MSYRTYNQLWDEAQRTLEDAIQIDTILQTSKPQKDKTEAFHGETKTTLFFFLYQICSN